MPVLRPTYKEGQILGAADLNTQLVYERLGMILHERTEHLWGVAQGLDLVTSNASGKLVDVAVGPGRAVDRLGRAIVVTESIPLDVNTFTSQFSSITPELYPIFVQATEVAKRGETQPGKCGVALETRIEEGVQVVFGQPGAEVPVLDPPPITVADGFGTPLVSDMVLIGWVTFDKTANRFNGVFKQSGTTRVRYVGVVASDVVAGGGELVLHTQPSGARFALSITEDAAGGCLLKFGKQDGNAAVADVFRIDEKGNVRITGQLTPAPVANAQAESGVSFDGLILPLPATVSDPSAVRLHVVVTPWPHTPQKMTLPNAATNPVFAIPLVETCSVDPATRAVSSSVRWLDPTHPETVFVVLPSACTYMIVASGK